MNSISKLMALGIALLCCCLAQAGAFAQEQKPGTAGTGTEQKAQPGAEAPRKEADIDPKAKELLQKVQQAYNNLKAVELSGEVRVNIDAAGMQEKTNQQFTSSFAAPNKFRHDAKDALKIGSNGDKAYVFNEQANSYAWIDIPAQRVAMQELPGVIPQILQTQNPSLLFALSTNSVQEVAQTFGKITRLPEQKIGDKEYPGLQFTSQDNRGQMEFRIDPENHLVRQFTIDFRSSLEDSGAKEVKAANVVVDYSNIKPQAQFATNHFAWAPPKDAMDLREAAGAARPAEQEKSSLIGKPAPNFSLTDMDGKKVSLSELKGQVVVLDFWATWCGPCVKSLPMVADVYEENKAEKVKVFAVNLRESKDKVEAFLDQQSIDIPVLFDQDGATAEKYNVEAIPTTVVIGADGNVQQVFTGAGPNAGQELRTAIQSARTGKQ